MFWLKKSAPSEPLAVSMSGVKLGDRLVVVGCGDPILIAQLALKTGLTGRACAVDDDAARVTSAARSVEREGALIETLTAPLTALPLDSESFDVVVLRDVLGSRGVHIRLACVAEAHRVLRPGGRAIVIESAARGGIGGLLQKRTLDADYVESGGAERALADGGFRAVRQLAERDGLLFVEGIKETSRG
jgi:ubiquinone/menaquinone biosynthesis C-methylase UbiE